MSITNEQVEEIAQELRTNFRSLGLNVSVNPIPVEIRDSEELEGYLELINCCPRLEARTKSTVITQADRNAPKGSHITAMNK